VNKLLVAWFCVGASIALLIYSARLSLEGTSGSVWLTLLMGLVLFLVGVLAMGKRNKL
jgi:hypothetical protein